MTVDKHDGDRFEVRRVPGTNFRWWLVWDLVDDCEAASFAGTLAGNREHAERHATLLSRVDSSPKVC